ncbi:MAG TPA: phage Gp37/Gp68 family protein [Alistipes sp.]|uniref:phage Gp37/Gp68 family protein n=1 Tax=unclassified Alistipes TaxID=2608932 RepID=UPI00258A2AA4|nr:MULTISPECIES: phage Gp37/Gp68 family protein [unclassified Alistipes]HUN13477.1 phage Gp37/Gp68 family protein [Alistipes sp.]
MRTTKIEWTERTWNPVTGCTKISAGCEHCYAETMSRRLCAMGNSKYTNGFQSTMHPEDLVEPMRWKKPSTIFVCSMSDLFHPDVPFDFIDKVFGVIRNTPQHNYQILTKRAERMAEYFSTRVIPSNVWIGVTVEAVKTKNRIDYIRNLKATVRFISCEPLLEDLGELNLNGINWIIVGGESGVQARPMKEEWVLNIKRQAEANHIPFFFKQWGTWSADGVKSNKKVNGKLLHGIVIQNMPTIKKA